LHHRAKIYNILIGIIYIGVSRITISNKNKRQSLLPPIFLKILIPFFNRFPILFKPLTKIAGGINESTSGSFKRLATGKANT